MGKAIESEPTLAASMFIRASRQCPSSITGQAAYIVWQCREMRRNPIALGIALQNDHDLLEGVAKTSNWFHRQAGIDIVVDWTDVMHIVGQDFELADHLRILPTEDLVEIYTTLYHQIDGELPEREFKLRREAELRVTERQQERARKRLQ